MLDQAQRLRQLAQNTNADMPHKRGAKILTVTSGKGGVGKSNIVVNLAITLQRMNKNVLIFDADAGMGNDDILMGFLPRYSIYDLLDGSKDIKEIIIKGPYGVRLIPGGSALNKIQEFTESDRNIFLNKLSEIDDVDFIIMDTGAGISRSVLGFIACCEELIIVTTPEPTSLTNAYSLLKAVNYFKLKKGAKVIINRVISENEGRNTFNKFSNAAANFLKMNLEYLGNVTDDKKITLAVRQQKPFVLSYPNCAASSDINNIAGKLAGSSNTKKSTNMETLFKKIFSIFS